MERAIKIVESTPKWGARVVYGDTDSLFVLLAGKSREEAFAIGEEIADAVTAINPPPVKLKFEKVLYPSILQVRYQEKWQIIIIKLIYTAILIHVTKRGQ